MVVKSTDFGRKLRQVVPELEVGDKFIQSWIFLVTKQITRCEVTGAR